MWVFQATFLRKGLRVSLKRNFFFFFFFGFTETVLSLISTELDRSLNVF
jgi:hypothetical protein